MKNPIEDDKEDPSRAIRGGDWVSYPSSMRGQRSRVSASYRYYEIQTVRYNLIGFRIVRNKA